MLEETQACQRKGLRNVLLSLCFSLESYLRGVWECVCLDDNKYKHILEYVYLKIK